MRAALVTGGGTGIGRAAARALSRDGYRVAVAGRRREPLEQTIAELGDGLVLVGDHADEHDAARFVAETVEQLGGLDAVVDNAGAIRRHLPVHEIPVERFDDQVRINLPGPFLVCPDIVDTPLARTDRDNWEAMAATIPDRYPVGRIGQPDDVGETIVFLAAPGASWVSGVVVDVDGGFAAGQ